MIWMLIVAGLIVAGIIGACVYEKLQYRHRYDFEWLGILSVVTLVCSIIVFIVCIGMIIGINVTADIDYQNKLHERDMLVYRIEHMEEDITGNEMLYNDIVEFNNELRTTKKWANSPWTNWFNNQKIASMDYIELESL